MDEDMMIRRGRGLVDLIAGKTPTLTNWTNNPTDAADITDGDISTFCTTGNKVAAAWDAAIFEWDLGAMYNVLLTGVGHCTADAGTPFVFLWLWNGAAWIAAEDNTASQSTSTCKLFVPFGGAGSKVRLEILSDANATISPNIREFHVWRL